MFVLGHLISTLEVSRSLAMMCQGPLSVIYWRGPRLSCLSAWRKHIRTGKKSEMSNSVGFPNPSATMFPLLLSPQRVACQPVA